MKQYSSAEALVLSLAKDCKNALQTSAQFEFSYNDIQAVITSMNNQNSSKVTIYSGVINGVSFSGSITALKKKLGIEYTKEYKRSAEASTRIIIKSDSELLETAKRAADRIKNAWEVFYNATQKYGLSRADMLERTENVESLILETLKRQRDKVAKEREEREAKQAAEAKAKAEAKRAELQRQLEALQKQLAEMQ